MNAALQALDAILQGAGIVPQSFARSSRYFGLPTRSTTLPDGRAVTYVSRRFVPHGGDLAPIGTHTVVDGDRLDNLAARYLGDPEQFWRICDANDAMVPDALVEKLGTELVISLPAGAPSGTRSL